MNEIMIKRAGLAIAENSTRFIELCDPLYGTDDSP